MLSDKLLSHVRTYIPIWVAALLTWLASVLGIVVPDEGAAGLIIFITAVVQGLWYALIRWLEPHLPRWLRVVLIGSTREPVYGASNERHVLGSSDG